MSRASAPAPLWHPRHWPSWTGVGLLWLLAQLPWPVKRSLARFLGGLIFSVARFRRHVVETNLSLCFPEKSPEQRRLLARAHYDALAFGVFELAAAWWLPSSRLPPHRIVGLENLTKALEPGRGALLLSGHFTTLEICGRLLSDRRQMGALYRDPNNPVIAATMHRSRTVHIHPAVHLYDLRGLVRALREGNAIWYAPDQSRRGKLSALVPFFGVPAVTNTATGKVVEMTHTAVVPFFARRETDHSYTLTLLPALENFPSGDPIADAARINQMIESYVRHAPDQYFWVHKRFKHRGPDHPEVY